MVIETTQRHLKEFGNIHYRYFESHEPKDGRVVSKCRNTWNCDCKQVSYHTQSINWLQKLYLTYWKLN